MSNSVGSLNRCSRCGCWLPTSRNICDKCIEEVVEQVTKERLNRSGIA